MTKNGISESAFPHLPFEIFRDLLTSKENDKALRDEVWFPELSEVDGLDLFRLNSVWLPRRSER